MFPLIETIRLQDGLFNNLGYHERRMQSALKDIFGTHGKINLGEMLTNVPTSGVFKCRLMYSNNAHQVEFINYEPKQISSLKLVYDDAISYPYKLSDRTGLENLFDQRGDCDDVLIIQNDWVTDTTIANVVFKKGNEWFTPSSYLLPGTMRQSMVDNGQVKEIGVKSNDIQRFDSFKIINAMLRFDAQEIPISRIVK
jgi:4-amino-4-deoxychorismate lyase